MAPREKGVYRLDRSQMSVIRAVISLYIFIMTTKEFYSTLFYFTLLYSMTFPAPELHVFWHIFSLSVFYFSVTPSGCKTNLLWFFRTILVKLDWQPQSCLIAYSTKEISELYSLITTLLSGTRFTIMCFSFWGLRLWWEMTNSSAMADVIMLLKCDHIERMALHVVLCAKKNTNTRWVDEF